ncbi:hypothetical protein EAE96_009310 [Botrytis aclada]|nr:hypothetical protein EAE96_009310 [Botrytis aclada]
MYSYSSWSTLALLASWLGKMDAYPTQSFLGMSSPESHSLSTHHQQLSSQLPPPTPRTLYTAPSFSSRSGTIDVRPPISHFSTSSSPLSIPFTLTSTCPNLHLDWTCLTSDLLSNLLLLYPTGPTSSPYYTFSPGTPSPDSSSSSSPSKDTYSISTSILLPTKTQGVEFKSSLYISISPASHAGVAGISKAEWRSFMGLLHGVNKGLEREMKGTGWGSLAMEGEFPSLNTPHSEKKEGGKRRARKEKTGPSDIIFPSSSSSSSSSSLSEKYPAYPRQGVKSQKDKTQESQTKIEGKEEEKEEEEEEISFSYKITWVYYGTTRDENGSETLRECAQMPAGVAMDFESGESGISVSEKKGQEEKEESRDEDVVNEEEQMWKIDL